MGVWGRVQFGGPPPPALFAHCVSSQIAVYGEPGRLPITGLILDHSSRICRGDRDLIAHLPRLRQRDGSGRFPTYPFADLAGAMAPIVKRIAAPVPGGTVDPTSRGRAETGPPARNPTPESA